MCSPGEDQLQCSLAVQRLMDADLLLPEEGDSLLKEIETWMPAAGSAYQFIKALEKITLADHCDVSLRELTLAAAVALLHRTS